MAIIVIDPGHGGSGHVGGSDGNHAVGANGSLEKNICLSISLKLAELFSETHHSYYLTRNFDTNLSLHQRAAVASSHNADVFVSIHLNSFHNPSTQGTETWVHSASTNSSRLIAASILQRLVQITGLKNRGIWSGGLGVLSPATGATLIEVSFLTNAPEEARLVTSGYQHSIAQAIKAGIEDYLAGATSNIVPVPANIPTDDGDI